MKVVDFNIGPVLVGQGGVSGSHFGCGLLSLRLETLPEHLCLLLVREAQRLTLVLHQGLYHAAHMHHEILHVLQSSLELLLLRGHQVLSIKSCHRHR